MLCKFLGIPSKMAITAHRSLYGQARVVSTNINNNICNDNNNNNNNNNNSNNNNNGKINSNKNKNNN